MSNFWVCNLHNQHGIGEFNCISCAFQKAVLEFKMREGLTQYKKAKKKLKKEGY